jgi:hypothetical protein
MAIPGNLSHFLDPLDLSTFGYLKKSMSKIQTVINLIHSNPHDFTYQLNPLALALTRCLGFENKNTARSRILEAEFVLQQLRGEDWKVRKEGFSDAGITPFNMERVLTECDLTRYLPSAAPPDNNPSELALTADDAADQIRSISQMSLDAVERVRLVRDVVLRTISDQKPISPAVADSALCQLADPRLSSYDVLSVSKEVIDVTIIPRKVARVHDEQVKEDKEKTALPVVGLAPKVFQRNLSYKDNINSVGQVKNLQATNEPTDKKKEKIQDDNSLTIRLRLLSHSSTGRKDYENVKDTTSTPKTT